MVSADDGMKGANVTCLHSGSFLSSVFCPLSSVFCHVP